MASGWPGLFSPRPAAAVEDQDQQAPQKRRKSSTGGAAARGGRQLQHRQQQQQCQHRHASAAEQVSRSPLALGVVAATSLYCGVKAGIQGYQHLRRRYLRLLVRRVAPVLDKLGVQYWADFGTLLGMYREKDIIFYDNDADLVLLNPDWDALLPQLRAALPGCRVFFVIPSEDASIRWIRVMAGIGVMDLYGAFLDSSSGSSSSDGAADGAAATAAAKQAPAEIEGAAAPAAGAAKAIPHSSSSSGAMVAIPQGHGDLCDVPADLIFPLGVLKFRGVPVAVPGNVPGVLRFRYGDTFMIPRYMDKGRDCIEQSKFYARLLGALGKAGLRV